ncbi:uncharacterized protein N7484_010421 [Penicillium longicatenatum]|uniref:uncharacterized protein n=1 Tax=Penicillium longicatenatum TaxID=1561947 RepID=UPI002548A219|nr:uncharacterized protein N7484_010421 [Penicillium longicatenatum]KAJ5630321.1 hypothetical protein N7484_010421 [Penicillium longicatenatum]
MAEFEEPQPSIRKHRIPFQVKSVALNFRDIAITIETGGVSITGLALAKATGFTTIITPSSDEKLEHVKAKYEVKYTINYKSPKWVSEAQKIPGGQGVDYILENGGFGTIKQSLEAIVFGRVISVIGFLSSRTQDNMPDVASLALSKAAVV